MPEITAQTKHACPACGAQAEWNPAKQKLVCPFCGTESAYQIDREMGKAAELDLAAALKDLPDDEQAWMATRRSVRCTSCNAVMEFEAQRVGQNCEFCGSPALVPNDQTQAPIRPQSLLPFKVDQSRIRDDMRGWFRSRWFAPNRLSRSALVDTVKSVYIPYWTFDAKVHCPWTAEAGYYYYVTVQARDAQGKPITRQERRVRWESASGAIDHVFDDEPIPATHGVPVDLLRQVEPFPTAELLPYDTAFLSGHVVERYQVVLSDAAGASLEAMNQELQRLCSAQVPGDTQRNLQIFPEYSNRTFKHVLVPIWVLSYTLGPKAFQVIANGYTAKIAGRYPFSFWKILFLVVFLIVVIGAIVFFSQEA